ncbi:hypothetical protein J6590_023633 [Homalodisca vitripennis]|nr:hypothetical protein J6590_023633 [Homalodisca vitripennis]
MRHKSRLDQFPDTISGYRSGRPGLVEAGRSETVRAEKGAMSWSGMAVAVQTNYQKRYPATRDRGRRQDGVGSVIAAHSSSRSIGLPLQLQVQTILVAATYTSVSVCHRDGYPVIRLSVIRVALLFTEMLSAGLDPAALSCPTHSVVPVLNFIHPPHPLSVHSHLLFVQVRLGISSIEIPNWIDYPLTRLIEPKELEMYYKARVTCI